MVRLLRYSYKDTIGFRPLTGMVLIMSIINTIAINVFAPLRGWYYELE